MGDTYDQTPYTKFNRHKERGTYDAETIHNLINTTSVLHVSFTTPDDSPFPVTLPMIGQIGQFATDSEPHCYLHGYVSSRMMRVCSSESEGLPMTITATKLDGLVLALTPFAHSYNYRSAILYGHATVLPSTPSTPEGSEENDETLFALALLTNALLPNRWQHTRVPPTSAERQSTRVLKVRIAGATAKRRTGPPKDGKRDLKDAEVVGRVWAGVVPVWECFGEPVGAGYGVEEVPGSVGEWVRAENGNAEEYAVGVAGEELKGDESE